MATLTDTKARNLKPEEKPLPHGGVTGLALHPSTIKGRGKWVLRYVSPITGKRRNAGLGSYPEVSVADAGNQARLMREQLSQGLDPLEIKREEATKPTIPTVEIAARQVHQQLLPGWRNPKHGKQWISTLEQYAFPVVGQAYLVNDPGNRNQSEAAAACCDGVGLGEWVLPCQPSRCGR